MFKNNGQKRIIQMNKIKKHKIYQLKCLFNPKFLNNHPIKYIKIMLITKYGKTIVI